MVSVYISAWKLIAFVCLGWMLLRKDIDGRATRGRFSAFLYMGCVRRKGPKKAAPALLLI